EGLRGTLGFKALKPDSGVVKISVIGGGMRSHAGVAPRMFKTLAQRGINIQVISTSEIKVSVLIAADYTELALRALHTAYGLDSAEFPRSTSPRSPSRCSRARPCCRVPRRVAFSTGDGRAAAPFSAANLRS